VRIKTCILGLTALVVTTLTASAAPDCKPDPSVKTINPGHLTVAVYNYPPFMVVGGDGQVSGLELDFVKAVAKANCLEFAPVTLEPAAAIQAVVSDKADVAPLWSRTVKRAKVVEFTIGTSTDGMGLASKDGTKSIDELKSKVSGTVQGYSWQAELQRILGDKLKLYPSPTALAQDFDAGRLDVAIDGYPGMVYAQQQGAYKGVKLEVAAPDERVPTTVKPLQNGWMYTKGNAALGKVLDAGIKKLQSEGFIVKKLTAAGFSAEIADVGEPRFSP
jgi:polar amino acid transport system substrate-binding protein